MYHSVPTSHGRKFPHSACICLLAAFLLAAAAHAQQQPTQQRIRTLDEPFRLRMDESTPTARRVPFEWGGWFRSNVWVLDEDVDRPGDRTDDGYHAARWQQLRLWGAANVDQTHLFYARGALDYWDWNHHTSFDGRDNDLQGFNLERGWYDFRLSRLLLARGEEPGLFDVGVKVGRQFVEFGTGLTLAIPLDAIVLNTYYDGWQLTSLGAWSIPSTNNIDRSVPDETSEDRCYWGLELRYHRVPEHEPFVYYLDQTDHDAGDIRNGQAFGYDSRYVGAGSRGRFFLQDLQYTFEGVAEFGKSYADSAQVNTQNIHAWAFDSELRYFCPGRNRSQFAAGYLLASGDSDRTLSPTNTIGGNRLHTTDTSFVSWGYRDTGLVLAPRHSNLGMVRLEASTFPAPDHSCFEELQVGAVAFLFHKQQAEGAISDQLSVQDDSYLGSEFDLFLNWRLTSDLAWMLRYGLFLPGDAFNVQKDRQLVFTGLTLNF